MNDIEVLSVGDVVTDAFIKLSENEAHTFSNQDGTFLAMEYRAKLPYDQADIIKGDGNAANASLSFAKLGLRSGLASNVGQDQHGSDIIASLKKSGVDTSYVKVNKGKKSNYNYILRYQADRTILTHHEQYDYDWPSIAKKDMPKWVYFSSIGKNTLPFHDDIADWLSENHEVKLAFSPGTFQIAAGAGRLKRIYKRTNILLLNREEAAEVSDGNHKDVHDLFDKLHALGPKQVIITDGPKGSYASGPEGRLFMPVYPDSSPPIERTGAGDAFSSTVVAAVIKGEPLQEALRWGPINSMNVVQHIGPHEGLLTEAQLKTMLKNAPEWYHSSPL